MTGYKKFLPVLGWGLLLVILAALQVSALNPLFGGLNLILLLILVLVIIKKYQAAIFSAWISGFLVGASHFSRFGLLSAALLILTIILITLHKKVFFKLKPESLVFMGVVAVLLYHFLEWLSINSMAFFNADNYESLGFYLLNRAVFFELIATVVFLLIIFYKLNASSAESILK